ncbi:metallophosphoesterase family protein [Paenibacillus hamazuiensis]|uniref:metallophosphoesterase family protein n=1 Tax=Paenibacillus hamazuiensis TaxID=2936508 RepID=UPI00200D5A91|nr:metallophosphoesterase family protein [Paenibacillus hamazuiensis]
MLSFREDGSFTIVQLTDLHWKDGGPLDTRTERFIRSVLEAENPDLVAITGDVIDKKECAEPLAAFERAVSPICEAGVPWAFVLGNHEHECGIHPLLFAAMLRRLPHSLYSAGPEKVRGWSNYVLPVRGFRSTRPAAALFMFDSGGKTAMPFGGTEWIHSSQIEWYRREAEKLAAAGGGKPLPSLAFFHIPLPEYKEVWDRCVCYGNKLKETDCPKINSGLFAALVESGGMMGTFAGHCHLNDYYGDLYGIRLCYARASGIGAKGPDEYERGARVVRLYEGRRTFELWQRLENGKTIMAPTEHEPEDFRLI